MKIYRWTMIWRPFIKAQTLARDPVNKIWKREAATIAVDMAAEAAVALSISPSSRRDAGTPILATSLSFTPLSNPLKSSMSST